MSLDRFKETIAAKSAKITESLSGLILNAAVGTTDLTDGHG
jgi:hypothetical protein